MNALFRLTISRDARVLWRRKRTMERMFALVVERPFAACAGVVGMLCLSAYPLARGRSLLLTTYLGSGLALAPHYALLAQKTAAERHLMLGARTLVALGLGR